MDNYNQNYEEHPSGYNQYIPQQDNISLGDWIVTIILTAIPLVNIVMLIIWAVTDDTHPSKKTWAQAQLIWMVISVILTSIFYSVFGTMILGFLGIRGL